MARPLADIDERGVFKLAKLQCTHQEIADFYEVDVSTITKRFSQLIRKAKELGKTSIRRAQFKHAINGSASLLIWLGKQHLGQADKIEHVSTELIEAKIEFISESQPARFESYLKTPIQN